MYEKWKKYDARAAYSVNDKNIAITTIDRNEYEEIKHEARRLVKVDNEN